jgi:hypothetical protein
MDVIFDAALDQWHDWESIESQWLLLNGDYTPNRSTQVWVADVVSYEVVVANYQRQSVDNPTRTVDTTMHRIIYDCDDPNFGGIDSAPPGVSMLCLAKVGTDDSDSLLLAAYTLNSIGAGPLQPLVDPSGVYWISQEEDV